MDVDERVVQERGGVLVMGLPVLGLVRLGTAHRPRSSRRETLNPTPKTK